MKGPAHRIRRGRNLVIESIILTEVPGQGTKQTVCRETGPRVEESSGIAIVYGASVSRGARTYIQLRLMIEI
jgi:hypothetical protein